MRIGIAGLTVIVIAAAAGLAASPGTASAEHLCGNTGSPAGSFDILTYEASDWRTTYSQTIELASQDLLFPDIARFSLPQLETGSRSAGSSTLVDPSIPPFLLKAIAWIESSWIQADFSVPYGSIGPVLVSHDCGYGIMQVTSGMQNSTGTPDLDQVMIGGHYGFNVAEGANILATKWNAAPNYRPIVGNRHPTIIEDWYYALWSYNGFAFTNHPLNPSYSPLRGVYRCDATQPRSNYPYQELVLGCMANPPVVGGAPLWSPQPVTLPNLAQTAFSLANWSACSGDRQCAGMDIPTPDPSHGDPTTVSGGRSEAIGSPALSTTASSFQVAISLEDTSESNPVRIFNLGTGPLVWRLSPSVDWIKLSAIQGVSLGTDLGWDPGRFVFWADAADLDSGIHTGEIVLQSHYAQGLPQKITVNLRVGWELSRSQMVAADVNGDGKDDVVGIYDYGGERMGIWNFISNGAIFTQARSLTGCAGCWDLSSSQMVAADVDGDGDDDIVGIYDYGGGVMGMWNFISDGTTFTAKRSLTGCAGCWDLSSSQMVAADVDGDGDDDIVGIYDYGGGVMGMWNFISDGTTFTAKRSRTGCAGCWDLSRSQMVAADVDGDGDDDIVGIYDYGDGVMGMWNFISDGSSFSTVRPSSNGCPGCWELSRSQMVAANVDGDVDDDIVGIYDYGGGVMGMWNFISDGSSFSTVRPSSSGCPGCWELSRSQMVAADVNGDGNDDIVGAYDYGGGAMRMWNFISNGDSFSTVSQSFTTCSGC